MSDTSTLQPPSFGDLVYRYWFYGWLFRDATRGSLLERASARRYNRDRARWLPVYLRRWTLLGFASWGIGLLLEAVAPGTVAGVVYLPCAVSIAVDAVTIAAWVGLRMLPAH